MNENFLHINDLFWTFQGEGFHAGRRALFVRMPFCNLTCDWCDTTFNSFQKVSESDFIKFATQETSKFAVITGGEPTMNKHVPRVISILKQLGFYIAMESNGTFAPPNGVDWLTVSPKKFTQKQGLPAFFIESKAMSRASEFKYVIDEGFDFEVLSVHNCSTNVLQKYYLSPEFGNFEKSLKMIEGFILKNPEWRVSLQTHKWANWK